MVTEGQEVEKGTKLFSYDNEEINLQMKQTELDQKWLAYVMIKEKENRFLKDRN